MNSGQYDLLCKFVRRDILNGVDRGLHRAVKGMMKENIRLSLKLVEIGGPKMKSQFWEYQDETIVAMRAITSKDGINYVDPRNQELLKREGRDL